MYSRRSKTAYTTEEAAARMGIHRETVRRWARENKLPFVRVGKTIVVPARALEKWISEVYPALVAEGKVKIRLGEDRLDQRRAVASDGRRR